MNHSPHIHPADAPAISATPGSSRLSVLFIKKNLDRAELELVLETHRRNIAIHVVASSGTPGREKLAALGIFTAVPAIESKFNPRLILTIRQLVRRLGVTLIHAPDSASLANAIWATYFIPLRIIAYRGTLARIRRHDPSFWMAILHPRVTRVICVSRAVYEHMSRYLPVEKLRLIYKGHDPDWSAEYDKNVARPAGIPADAIVLMYIAMSKGRPYKGLAFLLEAVGMLKNERIHLVCIGDYDPSAAETAHRLAPGRVHLLGETPNAAAYLRFADIYVLPSLREGLPRTIKEAMAAGLPVIASNIPGSAELVSDGESGLLVEPASSTALAQAIERLAGDETMRRRLGQAGKERLATEFGLERYIDETLALYLEDPVMAAT